MTILDDSMIANPPYSGPNKMPLPRNRVSDRSLDDLLSGILRQDIENSIGEGQKGGGGGR